MPRIYGILIACAVVVLVVGTILSVAPMQGITSSSGKQAGAFSFIVSTLSIIVVICFASVLVFSAGAIGYIFKEDQPEGWFWNYKWPLLLGSPGTGLVVAIIGYWILDIGNYL